MFATAFLISLSQTRMRLSRLISLPLCGAIVMFAAGAWSDRGAPAAHDATPVTDSYSTVKLADGIYAFISPDVNGGIVNGNSLLIIGDSGAIVIDAGHFPTLTRRMIGDIRTLTKVPVRYLVNTHWHPDHWVGNGEFRAAFPSIEIISTEETREAIAREGPVYLAQYKDPSLLGKLRALAAPSPAGDTTAGGRARRAVNAATLTDAEDALRSWSTARLELPNLTIDHDVRLHLGRRDVQVMFLGRGNTAGDVVVFAPAERILATGDLLVAPIPYGFDSFFPDWVDVLHKIKAMDPAIIVPGHGPVERDHRYLTLVTEFLTFVRDRADASALRGETAEQAKKTDLSSFESKFTHDDPALRNSFYLDWQVAGMSRAFEEAKVRLEK